MLGFMIRRWPARTRLHINGCVLHRFTLQIGTKTIFEWVYVRFSLLNRIFLVIWLCFSVYISFFLYMSVINFILNKRCI